MKIDEMYDSKWIRAVDLNGRVVVRTVDRVEPVEVYDTRSRSMVVRWAIWFREKVNGKALILNKTNAESIAGLASSRETDDWPGVRIELYAERIRVGGKPVMAVRVRKPTEAAALNGSGPDGPGEPGAGDPALLDGGPVV